MDLTKQFRKGAPDRFMRGEKDADLPVQTDQIRDRRST
jgi:hypothetical protein